METNVVVKLYPGRTRLLVIVRISWPGSVLFRSRALPANTTLGVAYDDAVRFAARRAKGTDAGAGVADDRLPAKRMTCLLRDSGTGYVPVLHPAYCLSETPSAEAAAR